MEIGSAVTFLRAELIICLVRQECIILINCVNWLELKIVNIFNIQRRLECLRGKIKSPWD